MRNAEMALLIIGGFVGGFVVATVLLASIVGSIEREAVEMGIWTHKKKAYRLTPIDRN